MPATYQQPRQEFFIRIWLKPASDALNHRQEPPNRVPSDEAEGHQIRGEGNCFYFCGYGKLPQHVTGEVAASYVARLPWPAKSAEEWIASLADAPSKPLLSAPVCRQDEDKANKAKDINDT